MKLFYLIVFLALSFALPFITAYENRKRGMLVSMALGALIYIISTMITNFTASALGMKDLSLAADRKTYAVMATLAMSCAAAVCSLIKNAYDDQQTGNLIAAGFSFINTFLYNMSSYSFLVFIAMQNSVEKLSKYYPEETAAELIDYFASINAADILLLCVEMCCTFFIFKSLICTVCKKKAQLFDYSQFIVGCFIMFYSQYCIGNRLVVFAVYAILLVVGYGKNVRLKGKNRYEK